MFLRRKRDFGTAAIGRASDERELSEVWLCRRRAVVSWWSSILLSALWVGVDEEPAHHDTGGQAMKEKIWVSIEHGRAACICLNSDKHKPCEGMSCKLYELREVKPRKAVKRGK